MKTNKLVKEKKELAPSSQVMSETELVISGVQLLNSLQGKEFMVFPKLKLKGIVEEEFLLKNLYKYAYIPWRIYNALATDKRLKGDPTKYVHIMSLEIKAVLGGKQYKKIIDDLRIGAVIKRSPKYIPGTHSYGYRLTPRYRKPKEWMMIIRASTGKKKQARNNSYGSSLDYLRGQLERIQLNPLAIGFIQYIDRYYNQASITITKQMEDCYLLTTSSKAPFCCFGAYTNTMLFNANSLFSSSYFPPAIVGSAHTNYTFSGIQYYNLSPSSPLYSNNYLSFLYVSTIYEQLRLELHPKLIVKKASGKKREICDYSPVKFIYDLINISKIYGGEEWSLYRDPTCNRVHTPITCLRSILKYFLKIRDSSERLASIDLANSQVFLVNLYLIEENIDLSLPDVKHFVEITSEGKFYEFVQEKTGIKDRDEVKTKFFAGYFFNENAKGIDLFKNFMKENFPTIHEYVTKEKEIKHNAFAIKLQQAESKFFIDLIVPKLIAESPPGSFITTLHDSIITNDSNIELVKKVIAEEFQKKSLSPTLKVQKY